MSHRLFVGCPIPAEASQALAEGAADAFSALPVRMIQPDHLHVTLLFYPRVSEEDRERMIKLLRQVDWAPIPVETGSLALCGRNALATELRADPAVIAGLYDRLWPGKPSNPLAELGYMLDRPEMDRFARMDRSGGLRLHLTLARTKSTLPRSLPNLPAFSFILDHLALYESTLAPGGSKYEVLAQVGG